MFTRLWKIGNTTLFDLQFVGDGMLAFFNAPHAVSDHAAQAREAAQAAQHSLDHFNQATDDAPSFQTRIGLATGEVLVGNIGTARHLSPYKTEQMVGQVRCWASLGSLVLAFLIF
jgi:class 3 adenylate cyclase